MRIRCGAAQRQVLLVSILAFVAAACSPSSAPATAPSESTADTGPDTQRSYALGEFPPFPDGALPGSTAEALQAALDAAVEDGTFIGVTAAVIVADRGSWAGATVRQVLGMRSGIPDLKEFTPDGGAYPAERASSVVDVFRKLPEPEQHPPTPAGYASTNYVLLGAIIEHVSGKPLADVLRSDVLDDPALDGLVYLVEDALAGDGDGVEATPAAVRSEEGRG